MTAFAALSAVPLDIDHDGIAYRAVPIAELKARGVPDDAVFLAVKSWLCTRIDDEAERLRLTLLTPGAGQALEYQRAQAEAASALALPKSKPPAPEDFPMLDATIGIDIDPDTGSPAADVLGVARSIQAAANAWGAAGAAIRRARLAGKAAIEAATTAEAAQAAFDAIAWPSPTA